MVFMIIACNRDNIPEEARHDRIADIINKEVITKGNQVFGTLHPLSNQ